MARDKQIKAVTEIAIMLLAAIAFGLPGFIVALGLLFATNVWHDNKVGPREHVIVIGLIMVLFGGAGLIRDMLA